MKAKSSRQRTGAITGQLTSPSPAKTRSSATARLAKAAVLGLALVLSWGLMACASPAPASSPSPEATASTLLWKVQSGPATAYLFGTMHVGVPEMYPLSAPVMQAFAASDSLVQELSPEEMGLVPAWMAATPGRVVMPAGSSSLAGLSAESLATLERVLGPVMPLQQAAVIQPWIIGLQLANLAIVEAGYDTTQGVDLWLSAQAQSAGKPILGLETAAFQLDLFSSDSLEQQTLELEDTLAHWEENKAELGQLISAYRQGDTKALEKLLLSGSQARLPTAKQKMEALITQRNRSMSQSIQALLAKGGSYFIAVGAGHMVGRDSIPQLLAKQGFTVQAVK